MRILSRNEIWEALQYFDKANGIMSFNGIVFLGLWIRFGRSLQCEGNLGDSIHITDNRMVEHQECACNHAYK